MEIRACKRLAFKIIILTFAILGIVLTSLFTNEKIPENGEFQKIEIPSNIETGDIVFRLGTGFWSPFFGSMNTVSGFSHVGVAIINEDGDVKVLHAESEDFSNKGGIQLTSIKLFKKESKAFSIKKNNMPLETKSKFVEILLNMKNQNVSFDDDFTLEDYGQRVYCTEYLWIAARKAGEMKLGVKSLYAGRTIISVDSIFQSEILE